jgi:N-acetylmuramoyl-L-alanine amidase
VRAFQEGRRTYLHLGDLAAAVGGSWGRDPLSREPLFTLREHRILFSSRDRRIAVDGRRQRLSAAVEFRDGGVWVPSEFLAEVLEPLADQPLILAGGTPPAVTPPEAAPAPSGPADVPAPRQPAFDDGLIRTVVIDAGHGGEEEGAKGPSGLLEKNVVLDAARRLRSALERLGFTVYLTRTDDTNLPLDERTALANNRKADLFLSLHANASPSPSARGAETYYLSLPRMARADAGRLGGHEADSLMGPREGEDPLKMVLWDMAQASALAESSSLAEMIQAEFNSALGIPDRGVKQAPFRVLVGAVMPAVLVEIGFISNPEEEARLQDPAFLDSIVGALSRALEGYRDRGRRRSLGRGEP